MSSHSTNKRVKLSEVPSGYHFTFKPGETNPHLIFRVGCASSLVKGGYVIIDFFGKVAGIRHGGRFVYLYEED